MAKRNSTRGFPCVEANGEVVLLKLPAPKPCPFCGVTHAQYINLDGTPNIAVKPVVRPSAFGGVKHVFAVECNECGAYGTTGADRMEAAQVWNRRLG